VYRIIFSVDDKRWKIRTKVLRYKARKEKEEKYKQQEPIRRGDHAV
jgi:hypothetical protein